MKSSIKYNKSVIRQLFALALCLQNISCVFSQSEVEEQNNTKSSKSFYTVGYQIGGHTIFGLNYEYKFSNHLGFHAGAGINGFTTGLKLHMNNCMECPHLNIAFKDGGFGAIGTAGAEFGARLLTLKKGGRMAIFAQFGYGYLLYLSDKNKENMFDNDVPPGIFTFGLGLGF